MQVIQVWIHGGSFTSGSGSDDTYVGSALALFQDVVVVTINYRLTMFGFFYTGDRRMDNGM